jgi:two-component system OmpR family response regulator
MTFMPQVLVVDDDPHIRQLLVFALEKAGLTAREAEDGEAALAAVRREAPDLVVLDINMPKLDGLEVCRRLRAQGDLPILFLSSRDDEIDRVLGIELGGDDYVTKPFSPRELVARVRALMRRAAGPPDAAAPQRKEPLRFDGGRMRIDEERHELTIGGERVNVTPSEWRLLVALADSPGRVYSRFELINRVQGYEYEGYERTIDAHVKNLRRKIEPDPGRPSYVETVHGVGYRLAALAG